MPSTTCFSFLAKKCSSQQMTSLKDKKVSLNILFGCTSFLVCKNCKKLLDGNVRLWDLEDCMPISDYFTQNRTPLDRLIDRQRVKEPDHLALTKGNYVIICILGLSGWHSNSDLMLVYTAQTQPWGYPLPTILCLYKSTLVRFRLCK